MKQTELNKQTAQQAAGLMMSAGDGKIWAAVVRRRDGGFERTHQAVFDLTEGLDSAVRQLLDKVGNVPTPVVVGLDSAQLR